MITSWRNNCAWCSIDQRTLVCWWLFAEVVWLLLLRIGSERSEANGVEFASIVQMQNELHSGLAYQLLSFFLYNVTGPQIQQAGGVQH